MNHSAAKPISTPQRLAMLPHLAACRPRQWTKNLLVFASPLFAFRLDPPIWLAAAGGFLAFCAISSAIYLLNDVLDVEADRAHPRKCLRPIAAGQVAIPTALAMAAALATFSVLFAWSIQPPLALLIALYGVIQVGYCLRFKRLPLLDISCIAAGFLLRAMAGGVASALEISPWFILTVGLLALFLAVEKRKAELRVCRERGVITRKVLERYSLPLLLRLESLVSTSAFMAYALWAAGPTLGGAASRWMLLSVPLVLVGIFRYQLLSDPEDAERRAAVGYGTSTEEPESLLLGDHGIKLILLAWLLTVTAVAVLHRLGVLPA
ncbi:MAG: decaprenyl-phosphate phosphoribosyltransferase [Prochlorococcaceae cyanobacterium]